MFLQVYYNGFLHLKTDFIIIISSSSFDMTLAVAEGLNPSKPNKTFYN